MIVLGSHALHNNVLQLDYAINQQANFNDTLHDETEWKFLVTNTWQGGFITFVPVLCVFKWSAHHKKSWQMTKTITITKFPSNQHLKINKHEFIMCNDIHTFYIWLQRMTSEKQSILYRYQEICARAAE